MSYKNHSNNQVRIKDSWSNMNEIARLIRLKVCIKAVATSLLVLK